MKRAPSIGRIASRRVYRGIFLSVHRDRVRLPGGVITVCDRIEHPPGVAVVPVLPDGRVALLRQYRQVLGEYLWEIPAGKLRPGETPEEGARRELAEEAGLIAGRLHRVTEFYPAPGSLSELLTVFVATELVPGRPHRDDDEVMRVRRFRIEQIRQMLARGRIRDAKSLVGLLALVGGDSVFSRPPWASRLRRSRRAPRPSSSEPRR